MIERSYSFGKASFNKHTHIIIDMDVYHGPLCRVGKDGNPFVMSCERDPELSVSDVECGACKRSLAYQRLLACKRVSGLARKGLLNPSTSPLTLYSS